MPTMKKFHKLLSASSGGQDSHLKALKAFAKISLSNR